jgi:uncharacterized membrane protein
MSTLTAPVGTSLSSPATEAARPRAGRLDSIDILRGLIMVIMALDHVRDFFHYQTINPTDMEHTYPALFLTRWITHYCAPTFIFLAGIGAYLYGARSQSRRALALFLLTRGLWILVLEITVIYPSWSLDFTYTRAVGQVLWSIGWSMIALAGLCFLPTRLVACVGLAMIVGHNYFDGETPESFGDWSWLWMVLHTGGPIHPFAHLHITYGDHCFPSPNYTIFAAYPLIPWIGVMASGYSLGTVFTFEQARRRRWLYTLGLLACLAFFLVRGSNVYGDPRPWSVPSRDYADSAEATLYTAFSCLNCHKYPPSLAYLLMTLGPSLLALALFDGPPGPVRRFLVVFGRVPMFFYLLHVPLIRLLALDLALFCYGTIAFSFAEHPPKDYGYPLWVVYLAWVVTVLMLYPFCYLFADLKRRRRTSWWLSYL